MDFCIFFELYFNKELTYIRNSLMLFVLVKDQAEAKAPSAWGTSQNLAAMHRSFEYKVSEVFAKF